MIIGIDVLQLYAGEPWTGV